MRVTTANLRRACELLLTHLEATGRPEIEIAEDFYWKISQDEAYTPYSTPSQLTMGQLSDDWNELMAIVHGNKEPIGYALVWLSSVIRRVGEKAP